jgi:hypothetical protein
MVNLIFDVPTNSGLDYFQLGLYNASGTLLNQFKTGTDKTYQVSVPATGSYYVAIQNANYYSGDSYNLTANYTVGSSSSFEAEGNNSISIANSMGLGSPITGQLSTSSDVDYYKFNVSASGMVNLIFDVPTNSGLDYFQLGLYNASGTLLNQFKIKLVFQQLVHIMLLSKTQIITAVTLTT